VSYYAPIPPTGYDNNSPSNVTYRLRVALDRDDRLNTEEQRVYDDTQIELEYGSDFFRRAHP
jgi:hypothetical protein